MTHTDTSVLLRQAHAKLGQAMLGWTSGATASDTLRKLAEAEAALASAKERLQAHAGD